VHVEAEEHDDDFEDVQRGASAKAHPKVAQVIVGAFSIPVERRVSSDERVGVEIKSESADGQPNKYELISGLPTTMQFLSVDSILLMSP
jgi:hypothetical protein